MNGRVYDPNIGRFLSVDPVFEFPTNTQSLNPYSYVLNNPLSMTDPTGYLVTCGSNQQDINCGQAVSELKPGQTTTQKVSVTPIGSHITSHATVTIGLTKAGNIAVTLASSNGAKLTQSVMEEGDKLASTSEKGSFTFRPNVKIAPVEVHRGLKGDLTNTMMQLYGTKGEVTSKYKPEWGDETVGKIAAQVCGETCGETGTAQENYSFQAGRGQIAHVRLNGIRKWISFTKVEKNAGLAASRWGGPGYAASLAATEKAVSEDLRGIDPTFGSRWYNMRTTGEVQAGSKRWGLYPFRTVYGPYSSKIHPYIVTYGLPQ
jgi:hypothetical protein